MNWINKPIMQMIIKFLSQKWYFDLIYNQFIVIPTLLFGHHITYKTLDRGLIEQIGPLGITHTFRNLSIKLSSLHSGHIYHYAFLMILGITLFLLGTETLNTLSLIPLVLIPLWV
jgi:NADH-quinone oxidoreductase subunit L